MSSSSVLVLALLQVVFSSKDCARAVAPALSRAPSAFSGAFYVSLAGNDTWSGTLPAPSADGTDGPFLTPAAAASAIQTLPRPLTTDAYVYVRTGTYFLNSTLSLGPGSGGDSASARVRWSTYPADAPGTAVLSGGAPITGWVRSSVGGVWSASLPATALARSRGLFVNGTRRWPARVPSVAGPSRADFASDASTLHFVSSLSKCGSASCWGTNCTSPEDEFGFVFNATDARSPREAWDDVKGIDVLVFGSWTAAWSSVAAVFDANATLLVTSPLKTATPGRWGIGTACPSGSRYILFNVANALVPASGEFYVDDDARTILYAPTADEGNDPNTLDIVVPVLDTVLSVVGDDCGGPIAFLDLLNLTFAHATDGGFAARAAAYQAVTGALSITSARDILVYGVSTRNTDGSGVMLFDNLVRVTLSRVLVFDVGGDGVGTFSNTGQSDGSPMNTTIVDSVVDGVGFLFYNQPGAIRVKGDPAGTVLVEHNLVRDSSYAGIMVSWQDGETRPTAPFPWRFVVRGNLVEACGNGVLSDFGGIYVSSSGEACQGTESCFIPTLVEGNLVRDIRGYNYGGEGVYTDENVAGVYITGNALGNVSGASVYLHCGDNHTVVSQCHARVHLFSERPLMTSPPPTHTRRIISFGAHFKSTSRLSWGQLHLWGAAILAAWIRNTRTSAASSRRTCSSSLRISRRSSTLTRSSRTSPSTQTCTGRRRPWSQAASSGLLWTTLRGRGRGAPSRSGRVVEWTRTVPLRTRLSPTPQAPILRSPQTVPRSLEDFNSSFQAHRPGRG